MNEKVQHNQNESLESCQLQIQALRDELARAEYREDILERVVATRITNERQRIDEVSEELTKVSELLEAVLKSNSWKLTLPLRKVMQRIRPSSNPVVDKEYPKSDQDQTRNENSLSND